jgi:hypothetical protein
MTTALPESVIRCMKPEDCRRLGLQTRDEIESSLDAASEAKIQSTVEAWLRQNGFWPRTSAFLHGAGKPSRGWYAHLHETKRNPILLDLLVWDFAGRVIEIELKTATGKPRQEQDAILLAGGNVHLCRGAIAAIETLQNWIEQNERRAKCTSL